VAQASAWAGFVLIVGSIMFLKESYGFPGWVAAFPVIGTALLIAPVGEARTGPLKLLAHPAMVTIGKRSYSLYLWHWPVFSLVDYRFYAASEPILLALKITITLVLTMLSYNFVERPARNFFNVQRRRIPMFCATATIVAMIAGGGISLRKSLYFDVPPSTVASGGTIIHGGDQAVVILSGDSQAAMYGAEIASIARARRFLLYALGTAGRNQLPHADGTSWPTVATLIARKKPDLVILIDAWTEKLKGDPASLQSAIADVAGKAKQVLLVSEPPSPPNALSRLAFRDHAKPLFVEPADERAARTANLRMLRTLEAPNVHVVDVANLFQMPNGALRVTGPDGRLTYFDAHHLSDTGTAITRPLLDQAIGLALRRSKSAVPVRLEEIGMPPDRVQVR
jgi:hypothetical protein